MVSVIIPTLNESDYIGSLIDHIASHRGSVGEILVSDAQSEDNTVAIAEQKGAKIISCRQKNRAVQMNTAARHARGDILYFLHADSIPPPGFTEKIRDAVHNGKRSGCFRLRFDKKHWFLQFNCWFTRFSPTMLHYGDQSLFITRDLFFRLGGYDERMEIMEDYDLVRRIRKYAGFHVLKDTVCTSARRYTANGIYRMQMLFYYLFILYKLGRSQQELLHIYHAMADGK